MIAAAVNDGTCLPTNTLIWTAGTPPQALLATRHARKSVVALWSTSISKCRSDPMSGPWAIVLRYRTARLAQERTHPSPISRAPSPR